MTVNNRVSAPTSTFLIMSTSFSFAAALTSVNNALLMRERGLSFTAIGMMVGVFFLVAAVTNIPTGLLADIFSRKLLVLGGYLTYGIGLSVFGFATTTAAFLIAHVVQGLGLSLWSGAFEAWYVDSLHAIGRYDDSRKSFGIAGAAGGVASVVAGLAAGRLIATNMAVPFFVAGAVALCIALYGAAAMTEPSSERKRRELWSLSRSAVKIYFSSPALIVFTAGIAGFELILLLVAISWQPHLVGSGLRPDQLGYAYSTFMLLGSLASLGYAWIGRRLEASSVAIFGCLVIAAAFSLVTVSHSLVVATVVLSFYYLGNGLARPAAMRWRNDLITHYRATLLSILATVSYLFRALFGAVAGVVSDMAGTASSLALVSAVGVVTALLLLWARRLQYRSKSTASSGD